MHLLPPSLVGTFHGVGTSVGHGMSVAGGTSVGVVYPGFWVSLWSLLGWWLAGVASMRGREAEVTKGLVARETLSAPILLHHFFKGSKVMKVNVSKRHRLPKVTFLMHHLCFCFRIRKKLFDIYLYLDSQHINCDFSQSSGTGVQLKGKGSWWSKPRTETDK